MASLVTTDPTLGFADSPEDHDALSSGWSLGVAAEDAWHSAGLTSLLRGADQMDARYGPSTRAGTRMFRPDATPAMLDPDQANQQFGIKGELSWDKPVRSSEAKLLNSWKREELQRRDALNRATPGAVPATARFLAGVGASMLDPVNAAASFIPVFGEARWAELAGTIGNRLARVARGAAEGFVGSAPVEPITYGQAQNEQADYDGYTALKNIAFGTIGGAGLHAVLGEAGDLLARDWRRVPQATREATLKQGATALTEGAPVRAAEIVSQPINIVADHINGGGSLDPARISEATGLEPAEVQRALSALATNGSLEYSARTGKFRRPAQTSPLDVISFLQSKGGIRDDEGHDLIGGRDAQRHNPRFGPLVRKTGMSIDDAGEALHEAGYFGDPATAPRPTEAQVLDMLDTALAGKKVYSSRDVGEVLDRGEGQGRDLAGEALDREAEDRRATLSDEERNAALDLMLSQGVDPSDALDHVLERSSIEGGVYQKPEQRLATVEALIEEAQSAGASLEDIAPLMDERETLKADVEAARTADQVGQSNVLETVQRDLQGEDGGSAAAVAREASDAAALEANEAPKPSERVAHAQAAAADAETKFRAVAGMPEAERAAAPETPDYEPEPRQSRKLGIPDEAAKPLTSYRNAKKLREHPAFKAAKGGDVDSAVRVVSDLVNPDTLDQAREKFGPDALYLPVVAEEATGRNKLPLALARLYADATGAKSVAGDIVQVNRVHHTDAGFMHRLISRAEFAGDVVKGGRYVLVDDVMVSAGTVAEMADYIRSHGGEVVGLVNLVDGSRRADYRVAPGQLAKLKERFGDALQEIGIDPEALTGQEVDYLQKFGSVDAFRNRIAEARGEAGRPEGGSGVRAPAPEGLSAPPADHGRLTPEEFDALHSDLAEVDHVQAQREAVSQLAACMIREGV